VEPGRKATSCGGFQKGTAQGQYVFEIVEHDTIRTRQNGHVNTKEELPMNWAHVHLMINHFPVIGALGAILLLVYALVRKSEEV
jgi:hypothetical protein